MLENGQKRPIPNPSYFHLLDSSAKVCVITSQDINTIPTGAMVTPFVQYNGSTYVLENGKRYLTDSATLASMNVASPVTISSEIFNAYTDAGSFNPTFIVDGKYYYVSKGRFYSTTSASMARIWNVSSQVHTSWLLSGITNGGQLDQYARSSDPTNGTIY